MARRSYIRVGLVVVLAAALAALVASDPGYYSHETVAGDYVKRIDVAGRRREFRLHLPSGFGRTRHLPLVLVFHGSSASASVIERETNFDALADSVGFIVAYPEGLHRGWNIGECCRYSFKENVSDIAFAGALIAHLELGLGIDSTRIYAAGYSDGGTLSMLLACSMSDRIAAIGTVSGTLFDPLPPCNLSRPVPVIVIHGTGDTHIPYAGQRGLQAMFRGTHANLSAPEVARFWTDRDSCEAPPQTTRSGRVVRMVYDCADSTVVTFFTIEGGEHGWPGGGRGWIFSPRPPSDMSATDSIVTFLMRYHLPSRPQR